MARTQSFDQHTVIRAARTLFWRSGYETASIPDLEEATGLSRSSIYNSFGSKRGLFDAAVQNYLDEVIRPRLKPLTATQVEADAITTYLTGLRDAFSAHNSMPAHNGCLLINTAGAPIAHDRHVAHIIADYRTELHDALARGVTTNRPHHSPADNDQLTDTLTGLVISAFALTRIDPDSAMRTLITALDLLNDNTGQKAP